MDEVIKYMDLREGSTYLDCTVGGAGHLMAMLNSTKDAKFIGVDCDPDAIEYSRKRTAAFSSRCCLTEDNFINLDLILDKLNVGSVDGILFDLGVSYHQLTTPSRGFSYDREGRLLMRMSPKTMSLRNRLQHAQKHEVIQVLKDFGDVRNYRKLGQKIYESRVSLDSTLQLSKLIEESVPRRFLKKNLQKVFQALRIWTNEELTNLAAALPVAFGRLSGRGRMVVISYHSGEDRIVKFFFRDLKIEKKARLLNKKAIKPSEKEISLNPRVRSAKLRVLEKCAS
ncbi:MAG: 16S rRNA (cytosine(1402)-N(4))-methyltransferase RsmH [candidate division WOR-3 bacterium]|nr:MAG: 16S rRNA (cytosine(1402)-N(4))-methyltransferase RsmH [candidate division WOR-3 bacterium]